MPSCEDACDTNDDGALDVADGVFLLGALFLPSSPAIPEPFECGEDPTPDLLSCGSALSCF